MELVNGLGLFTGADVYDCTDLAT